MYFVHSNFVHFQNDWLLSGLLILVVAATAVDLRGQEKPIVVNKGTVVKVQLTAAVSSATFKLGDRVEFKVAEDVREGSVIVAPAGSNAGGFVANVASAKDFGAGTLIIVVSSVTGTGGIQIPVYGSREATQDGADAVLPEGTEITAEVAIDVSINAQTGAGPDGALGPTDAAARVSSPDQLILKKGTPIPLKLVTDVYSEKANIGDPVKFTVAEDVMIGRNVIIPAGAEAWGFVADAHSGKEFGAGSLSLYVGAVTGRNGLQIPVDGTCNATAVRGDTVLRQGTVTTVHVSIDVPLPQAVP